MHFLHPSRHLVSPPIPFSTLMNSALNLLYPLIASIPFSMLLLTEICGSSDYTTMKLEHFVISYRLFLRSSSFELVVGSWLEQLAMVILNLREEDPGSWKGKREMKFLTFVLFM